MIADLRSFIAGVQVGRRLKVADAMRKATPIKPVLAGVYILAEDGTPIVAERIEYDTGASIFDSDIASADYKYLITEEEEEVSLPDG